MFMLFYKHLNELYRSYSKSLRYFGSSPVDHALIPFGIVKLCKAHKGVDISRNDRYMYIDY